MTKNYILLFLIITSSSSSFTHAIDTITTTQIFTDNGGSLISSAGRFELGFFSPNDSHNRYVGIWYKKIIPRTVVWVANHENPLTDTTDTSRLSYVDTHPDESRPNNDLELPLFDLVTLTKATDSFSLDNKLGEGGFGPLYKARLDDGQEIAVKCLSKTPFKE